MSESIEATAKKQAEISRLRRRVKELDEENDFFLELMSALSHDIKPMLRTIVSFSSFLSEDYEQGFDEDDTEYLQILQRTARRLKEMTDALFQLAHIGIFPEMFDTLDIGRVLAISGESLRVGYPHAVFKFPADPPAVKGDTWGVPFVFDELMINGVTHNDSVQPKIEVGWVNTGIRDRRYVLFFVRDNGCGIEDRHKQRVFAPFERLDPRRGPGALGVGLTFCRRIVQKHGGKIWVESDSGQGSIFWFALPRAEAAVPPRQH